MTFNVIVSIVLLVALATGIFFYDRMYTNLTKKNKELAYKNSLIDMEMKAFNSQMNAHFVYSSLSAAQYLIMINENEKAFNYLSDFSLLLRKMFENAKKSHIPLNDEIQLLKGYIELEKLRFNNSFNYIIETDELLHNKNYKIPTMMIQPIVENAIRHGLAPKKELAELKITFRLDNRYLICRIEDNGIGLKKDAFITNHNKTSALKIIQERLHVINSFNQTNGSLEIIDKRTKGDSDTGIIVKLILPFEENS
jgi:LytS/YehU family sensor histidine kinase